MQDKFYQEHFARYRQAVQSKTLSYYSIIYHVPFGFFDDTEKTVDSLCIYI